MTLTTPASATPTEPSAARQAAAVPEAPKKIRIELAQYTRYVRKGVFFESEKFYEVTQAQAEMLFDDLDDYGVPIFRRYRPPVPKEQIIRDAEGRRGVDMSRDTVIEDLPDTEHSSIRAINVGDDDELRKEGIDLGDNDTHTV